MIFSSFCFAVVIILLALGISWVEAIIATKLFNAILNGPLVILFFVIGLVLSVAFFNFLGWWFFGRR